MIRAFGGPTAPASLVTAFRAPPAARVIQLFVVAVQEFLLGTETPGDALGAPGSPSIAQKSNKWQLVRRTRCQPD